MEKEKVFTSKSQLTVGIVSLLPSNHYLAEIKDVFRDILRYSTLLKVVQSADPDLVITLSEYKAGVRLTMNHGDDVLMDVNAQVKMVPQQIKTAELYRTVYHLLMQEKRALETLAYQKWVDQYNVLPEKREIVFTITDTCRTTLLEDLGIVPSHIGLGYTIALTTVRDEIRGREKEDARALDKLAIHANIIIQEIPDDPGNVEVLLRVVSPEGFHFMQMKNPPMQTFGENPWETAMVQHGNTDRMCTTVIESKLASKNLHNANMQKALRRMRDANEFTNILLLDYEDDWIEEIDGVMEYVLLPEMASNNLALLEFPKENLLPFKIEEIFTYQPTANLVGADIREIMSQPALDSAQKPVDIIIDYQKEGLSVSCKLDGQVLAKAKVPLAELQNNNQKTMIFTEIKEKMLNDLVVPLSIAAMKPAAQA